ncbi:MAG: hypothetical protein HS108_00655 [Planctomycetes bacterium]|jgi:hypothetical protein|nr:hypothetical protein [Planctomycetota bacterium]MCL4730357.1 hypothetical protein [Planctomycetota bacterium]
MQPDDYKPLPPEAHAFLDGSLGAEAEADFRRRLERDPALRDEVERLGAALNLLHTLPVKDPGPGFARRVLDRVRDVELADRARRRIRGARSPLWQHVAQVAAGAVAAAVVLALVGPSWRDSAPARPDGPLFETVAAEPAEDDLLPSLGDQYARYRAVADHVGALQGADAETQRLLLAAELDQSGLLRRNVWLNGQLGALALDRRREYQRFLDGLDNAIEIVDRELAQSAAERRPVNLGLVQGALDNVHVPPRLSRDVRLEVRRSGPESGARRVSPGPETTPEQAAYAAIRAAVHANDHEAVAGACDAYLRGFPGGKLVRPATLTLTAALLRLGRDRDAAARYEQVFGVYEEKRSADDVRLMERLLTPPERTRLKTARAALRE